MKILAFVTSKGGAGKSTLSASLAVAAREAGERAFLIDLDPQASLLAWGDRRQADEPSVDHTTHDRLPAALAALADAGYSLAVLDTAGVDSAATAAAMRVADLSIIPCRPSALDLEAARPTITALHQLDRPYAFVLNACSPGRTARIEDASRALGLLGVLAPVAVVQRAAHMDAVAAGMGITEFDPEGKGAEEVRTLWTWIKRKMEAGAHAKARVA